MQKLIRSNRCMRWNTRVHYLEKWIEPLPPLAVVFVSTGKQSLPEEGATNEDLDLDDDDDNDVMDVASEEDDAIVYVTAGGILPPPLLVRWSGGGSCRATTCLAPYLPVGMVVVIAVESITLYIIE